MDQKTERGCMPRHVVKTIKDLPNVFFPSCFIPTVVRCSRDLIFKRNLSVPCALLLTKTENIQGSSSVGIFCFPPGIGHEAPACPLKAFTLRRGVIVIAPFFSFKAFFVVTWKSAQMSCFKTAVTAICYTA